MVRGEPKEVTEEEATCAPRYPSTPLHFLASVAVKQDQVAGAGQWIVSRRGTCHFQVKAFRASGPFPSPCLGELGDHVFS